MTRSLHESLSKVQGRESLIFLTYVTFSIDFPIYITIICSPMLLILFFYYFGKDHPKPTRFSPLLFMFLWRLFLAKYDKIMSKNDVKFAQKEVFCKRSRIED